MMLDFILFQALFHIPAVVNWLQSDADHLMICRMINGEDFGDCITCSVSQVLDQTLKQTSAVAPYLITNKISGKFGCLFLYNFYFDTTSSFSSKL